MKYIYLFILTLVWFNYTVFAKQKNDSISIHRHEFAVSKKDNNARLYLYLKLATDYRRNNYDSSIFYGRKGLNQAKQMGYKLGEIQGLIAIEFGIRETGNLAEALNIQLQALEGARELKSEFLEGVELNSIGNTYLEMGDPKTGLEYYRKSSAIFRPMKKITNVEGWGRSGSTEYWTRNEASNIGNTFEMLNRLDSALRYETALYHDKQFPPDLMPELLCRLGNVYVKLGKDKEAMQLYQKGAVLSFPVNTVNDRAIIYYQMAVLYNKWNRPDSSLYYAQRSFRTARAISLRKVVLNASLLIADLYSKSARLDSAYYYQHVAIKYKDTLFSVEKFRRIQLVLSQEQQRQQKLLQEREELKNRYRVIGAVAVLVFVLIILLLVWRNNRVQTRKNRLLSIQKTQITEQRDTMQVTLENLHKTQTQLIQSEKMASLGELTAGIAHEIQNPLNFVNNFSEVSIELLDELKEAAQAGHTDDVTAIATDLTQNLEKINHHGKRADFIVKGMLQHSRTSTGEKQLTNINLLADEFLKLSYHGLRAKDKNFNAELITNFDETLPKVNAIQQDIGRVLLNLFNNAFYAVNEKKKTADTDYKPEISITTSTDSGNVVIKVKDNGNGIPDAVKEKIMQPFFTTKPTGEGTGLGLSLSYDIVVKGHGGKIDMNSIEGKGSEFIISIPINN